MEKELRIIGYIENICERGHVALEGDLVCECGNVFFTIYHSGKQTKGIFAPYLVKKNHQILIEARCTCCEKRIVIFDSSVDGSEPSGPSKPMEQTLKAFHDIYAYKIHVMYNYLESNFKTNLFEDCFIQISNSKF